MSAELISGKDMAASIREEIKERVAGLEDYSLTCVSLLTTCT